MWNSAAQVADAYQIGRVESNATINLHTKVAPEIVDRLAFLVKNLSYVVSVFKNINSLCHALGELKSNMTMQ